jgi:octaprenyl-diphosphate synthase
LTLPPALPHSPAIRTTDTPKPLESVPLSVSSALNTLREAGAARDAGSRLQERLADAQSFLGEELIWLEAELSRVVSRGPEPAADAARHLVALGGKRVRPLALLLSAACLGPIPAVARDLGLVVELVHSATLLHDDVVDEAVERRGAASSRRLWGNGMSVLAGDLLLVSALERTHSAAPWALGELVSTLRCLVEGEIIQLRGRTELDVSEHTYEAILKKKTASLFAWATRTGAELMGTGPEQQAEFAQFGESLGIAFQLVDDVLDYSGENTGKSLFADLTEGKLTLPLVLAVARRPELVGPLKEIHAGNAARVSEVSRAVVESGACEAVRERAIEHTERAVAHLSKLSPTPARALLEQLAFQLALRVR